MSPALRGTRTANRGYIGGGDEASLDGLKPDPHGVVHMADWCSFLDARSGEMEAAGTAAVEAKRGEGDRWMRELLGAMEAACGDTAAADGARQRGQWAAEEQRDLLGEAQEVRLRRRAVRGGAEMC